MLQQWIWGNVPAGFKKIRLGCRQMMVVRKGVESNLAAEKLLERGGVQEASTFQGRAKLGFLRMEDGGTALVRPYRHGGMLRHLTRGLFFTWPPRPFIELAMTEEVCRRGISTLEILAACVERVCGPIYRGWLVTRELLGARDLWSVLQDDFLDAGGKKALLESVARTLRRMHRRGVYHGDLNLKNILVRREADQFNSYIIDFDKARLFPGEVPAEMAQKNVARLHRSVGKLDPQRRYLSQSDWDLLIGRYRGHG